MIAAVLLAGVCAAIPVFGAQGAPCSPARQLVECGCDECFQWTDANAPGVTRSYTVTCSGQDGTTLVAHLMSGITEEGQLVPPVSVWCPAKAPVREGVAYTCTVKACGVSECSTPTPSVGYVGAPFVIAPPVANLRPPVKGN